MNKNSVPNDPQKPFVTSGIRVGTPAVTRRGFNEQDCRELAGWMCDVLDALGKENEEQVIAATKEKVLVNLQTSSCFTHNADSAFICDVSGDEYRRLFFNVERQSSRGSSRLANF